MVAFVAGSLAAMVGQLRHRGRLRTAFYLLLALMAASDLLLGECALTQVERAVRSADRPGSAYRESFVMHYMPWLPARVGASAGRVLVIGALLAWPAWGALDRLRARGRRREEAK